jgi:hypothetical protein
MGNENGKTNEKSTSIEVGILSTSIAKHAESRNPSEQMYKSQPHLPWETKEVYVLCRYIHTIIIT